MGKSADVETFQNRLMIDDRSQDVENPVVAQGRFRAAMESDSELDVSQLLAEGFKPGARLLPLRSKCSAKECSPSQGSSASNGRWAAAQADQQLVPTAMETDSESDELPARRKRRVCDGATRSPQTRRRRRVLRSSSESSGENGSVSARRSGAARSEEEVQHPGGDVLMPADASGSSDGPLELEDGFDDSDFGEEFTTLCMIVPRPRPQTISQLSTLFWVAYAPRWSRLKLQQ
jgi:hypothetical protein